MQLEALRPPPGRASRGRWWTRAHLPLQDPACRGTPPGRRPPQGSRFLARGASVGRRYLSASWPGPTLASSPTPLSARRSLRLALAVGACFAAWTAMLRVAGGPTHPAAAGLSVEAAGMLAVALAAASVAAPLIANGLGGLAGGPTLVSFLLAAIIVQQYWPQWTLFAFPGTPAWEAAHLRWPVLAGASSTLVALASLDPARRLVTPRRR